EVQYTYQVIDAVHLVLPAHRIDELALIEDVVRVEDDEPLALHLDTSRPSVRVGPPVWNHGFTGQGATIAVVDTGVDSAHPGLQGRVARSVVFTGQSQGPVEAQTSVDSEGHGTHVAGIAAGSGEGSQLLTSGDRRYAGVAIASQVVSLDISQSFSTSTAIKAFDWIHQNHETYDIKIVQNSWGRKDTSKAYDPSDSAVKASNALVRDDGLLLVFSAANAGPDPSTLSMEAQNPNVLTVGAVDDAGRVASFSSRGPVIQADGTEAPWTKPDVVAPGVRIKSATAAAAGSPGTYHELSGTSQAAPHVAGMAALVRQANPDLDPLEVMELFRRTARDLGPPGPGPDTGYGLADAARALETALEAEDGQLVFPREEVHSYQGTLSAGTPAVGGLLGDDDTGLERVPISGVLPVKEGVQRLNASFTWTPARSGAPAPDLRVTLTAPGGQEIAVPSEGRKAQRSLANPAPGDWTWTIRAAGPNQVGVAEYNLTNTLLVPQPIEITGDFGGSGGFFDSPLRQARAALEDAGTQLQEIPSASPSLIAALLALAAGALRRRR
ncbi:MAG: S8 family serine peptidase, partial [Candidatus Thermoplasmatota archaeon]|nr:S8 family serine peptidase [Candidatus Thermoplasmatota archaeon]